jgi:hypothetical protein
MERTQGHWWEPGSDESHPGVLTLNDDGGATLELIGGIDLRIIQHIAPGLSSDSGATRDTPILHGRVGAKEITLVNCIATRTTGMGSPSSQVFVADQVLIGALVESRDEPVVRRAFVRIENLTAWGVLDGLSWTPSRSDEDEHTAHLRRVPDQIVNVGGWTYALSVNRAGFNYATTRETATITGDMTARIIVTPPGPVSLNDLNATVQEMTDFLTLASGQAAGLISMTIEHAVDREWRDPRKKEGPTQKISRSIKATGRRIYTASPTESAMRVWDFRFTAQDLPFAEVWPKWMELRRLCSSASNVYFGDYYAPPTYTELRLFSVAVTAEALHAKLFGEEGASFDDDAARIARDLIKEGLEGEVREMTLSRIQPGATFRERLEFLAAVPDPDAVRLVIPDVAVWARRLKEARNGVAHGAIDRVTPEAYRLYTQTRDLVALVFLHELGFSPEVQKRAASDTMQHWIAAD